MRPLVDRLGPAGRAERGVSDAAQPRGRGVCMGDLGLVGDQWGASVALRPRGTFIPPQSSPRLSVAGARGYKRPSQGLARARKTST
jgi:hypothetical protein